MNLIEIQLNDTKIISYKEYDESVNYLSMADLLRRGYSIHFSEFSNEGIIHTYVVDETFSGVKNHTYINIMSKLRTIIINEILDDKR